MTIDALIGHSEPVALPEIIDKYWPRYKPWHEMSYDIRARTLALYFEEAFPNFDNLPEDQQEVYENTYGSMLSLNSSDQVWALRQIELAGRK